MKSKTCTLHAISLCLLPLLTAGCLSDNLLSDHPGTPTGPIEIRIKSSIVGSTSATTRAEASPVEKGMINEDMTFNVKFARVDATDNGSTPTYSAAYVKAVPGTVTSKVLAFTDPEYYQPDGKKTKLIGWYPAGATYATSADNVSTVTFSVDGETDIMVTPLKEGDKTSTIQSIAFEHLLTQVSVKVYATDANTKALWGGLESVSIAGKKQTCVLTLPVTSSSAETKITTKTFTATDGGVLPLVKKKPADNSNIEVSGNIYGTDHPLDLGENKDAAVLAGYAMFEPVAGNSNISLTVKTANREAQTVAVPAPSGGFVAGSSYVVTLHFEASSIAPSISVTQWIESTEGPEVTV